MHGWRKLVGVLLLGLVMFAAPAGWVWSQSQDPATAAAAAVPTGHNDAAMWRQVRQGETGYSSSPSRHAGTLIQSEGESWRSLRNGPYVTWAAYILLGMTAVLALFFALRGRIHIEHGRAGVTIQRFNFIERFAHWLTAVCFIVLALTGLNLMFGRTLLLPLVGKEAFASLTMTGKYLHNYLAFGFMLGIVLMFLLWVWHNIPNRHDLVWLAKGGGLFGGGHPPSKKFNAGQKLLFWAVILGGLSLSLSGLQLLFPYELHFFGKTFAFLNGMGLDLPTAVTPLAEQQLATLWHGFVGVVLIAIIIAHIYIGSLGMEGAFAAMGSGKVDLNWAKEHHDLWVEEVERKRGMAPAE